MPGVFAPTLAQSKATGADVGAMVTESGESSMASEDSLFEEAFKRRETCSVAVAWSAGLSETDFVSACSN